MRKLLPYIAAVGMILTLLFVMPAMAQEETRTKQFFEGASNFGGWLWDRSADAVDGIAAKTNPEERRNQEFAREAEQAKQVWNERLAHIAGVINKIDEIPGYCRDPSAIELWPAMPRQCLTAIDMHLSEVQTQLSLVRNEIKAELQMPAIR